MTRPWETLDRVDTPEGPLVLLRRGARELMITIDGRVLMNGVANRSELALAELACAPLHDNPAPAVLIGGLGLGFTLRAALNALPASARVTVAELNETVVRWCRGPAADLTAHAVDDPRVRVELGDVAAMIARTAKAPPSRNRFDAILLDLYEGPHEATQRRDDPFYGPTALGRTRAALTPDGIFAVWSEERDAAFEKRLVTAGFQVERKRAGRGGRRHVIYLARPR
ncbi:MAG: spermidine synthase [bacterium]